MFDRGAKDQGERAVEQREPLGRAVGSERKLRGLNQRVNSWQKCRGSCSGQRTQSGIVKMFETRSGGTKSGLLKPGVRSVISFRHH